MPDRALFGRAFFRRTIIREEENKMKFAGVYGIVVGILLLVQSAFFLETAQLSVLESDALRIVFHLAAEFVTAIVMIAGGTALLQRKAWAPRVYYLASGMMIYTVINSSGHFLQLGQWIFVGMLAVLLMLTVVSLGKVVRTANV